MTPAKQAIMDEHRAKIILGGKVSIENWMCDNSLTWCFWSSGQSNKLCASVRMRSMSTSISVSSYQQRQTKRWSSTRTFRLFLDLVDDPGNLFFQHSKLLYALWTAVVVRDILIVVQN